MVTASAYFYAAYTLSMLNAFSDCLSAFGRQSEKAILHRESVRSVPNAEAVTIALQFCIRLASLAQAFPVLPGLSKTGTIKIPGLLRVPGLSKTGTIKIPGLLRVAGAL